MMCVAAIAVATVTWALVGYSLAFDGDRRPHRRPRLRVPARRHASRPATGRRSRTCSSWPSRRPSASSRSRWSRAPSWSGCASAPFLVFAALWSVLVYAVLAHWAFGGGWLLEQRHARLRRRRAGRDGLRLLGAGGGARRRARARTTGARRCCPTTRSTSCSAPACCGSAGSASTAAAASRPATPACSRSRTRCCARPARCVAWFALDLLRGRQVTAIGAATAIIVGCVGITPAGGFISPGWAMALGALAALPELRGDRLAAAHAGRRDARRARRPRDRGLHRHPLHRLLRPALVERRLRRPRLRQRRASSATRRWPRSPRPRTRSRRPSCC